jgi:hypothetical protein
MTAVYTKGMLATIGSPGMRLAQYTLTMAGSEDAGLTINAKDVGLSSIYSLSMQQTCTTSGSVQRHYEVGIGTFTAGKGDANYATVRAHETLGTDIVTLGSHTMEIFAVGI